MWINKIVRKLKIKVSYHLMYKVVRNCVDLKFGVCFYFKKWNLNACSVEVPFPDRVIVPLKYKSLHFIITSHFLSTWSPLARGDTSFKVDQINAASSSAVMKSSNYSNPHKIFTLIGTVVKWREAKPGMLLNFLTLYTNYRKPANGTAPVPTNLFKFKDPDFNLGQS